VAACEGEHRVVKRRKEGQKHFTRMNTVCPVKFLPKI
jgi:hypothetical protein